ncbi:MAG: hypothetical protein EPO58_12630 [Chitinophagaceae bacterium]|nr:MAG: hypothetical protein EPO58_12630 [Chitinophagaceae bacterium]
MKLQKANSEIFEKRINYYKEKSLTELQSIIPKWAYDSNSDRILDTTLHPSAEEYFIFLVETKKLIQISELHEVNPDILFTGDKLNDGRVATILHRWDNNQFIDPPTVEIFDRDKSKLCFSDGRHRSKTNYLLGHKKMPIAIHRTQIKNISKLLELTPV